MTALVECDSCTTEFHHPTCVLAQEQKSKTTGSSNTHMYNHALILSASFKLHCSLSHSLSLSPYLLYVLDAPTVVWSDVLPPSSSLTPSPKRKKIFSLNSPPSSLSVLHCYIHDMVCALTALDSDYHNIARKFGHFGSLAVYPLRPPTTKLKSANISFLHTYGDPLYYRTTKFKLANVTVAMAIWDPNCQI